MIILASQSPTRQNLLRDAGLAFASQSANYDEQEGRRTYNNGSTTPLALHLAIGKAFSLPLPLEADVIVAADQTLFCRGKYFSKPATMLAARDQLIELRNTTHTLTSAVVCRTSMDPPWHHVAVAQITMRDFSDNALEHYLQQSGPSILQSVGSYVFEGTGIQLISEVRGDYHTILGLPVFPLLNHLRNGGFVTS